MSEELAQFQPFPDREDAFSFSLDIEGLGALTTRFALDEDVSNLKIRFQEFGSQGESDNRLGSYIPESDLIHVNIAQIMRTSFPYPIDSEALKIGSVLAHEVGHWLNSKNWSELRRKENDRDEWRSYLATRKAVLAGYAIVLSTLIPIDTLRSPYPYVIAAPLFLYSLDHDRITGFGKNTREMFIYREGAEERFAKEFALSEFQRFSSLIDVKELPVDR